MWTSYIYYYYFCFSTSGIFIYKDLSGETGAFLIFYYYTDLDIVYFSRVFCLPKDINALLDCGFDTGEISFGPNEKLLINFVGASTSSSDPALLSKFYLI